MTDYCHKGAAMSHMSCQLNKNILYMYSCWQIVSVGWELRSRRGKACVC